NRRWNELDAEVQARSGQLAVAQDSVERQKVLKEGLSSQFDVAVGHATTAFRDPDVDFERVERERDALDEQLPNLEQRIQRCEERARAADETVGKLLPDAWSQLAQYGKDHGISIDTEANHWRAAQALLSNELTHLRGTELVNY